MASRKPKKSTRKTKVNLSLDADLARRLRAFATYHNRNVSDVVADAVKPAMRGFSVRQDAGPRLSAFGEDLPAGGDRRGGEEAA